MVQYLDVEGVAFSETISSNLNGLLGVLLVDMKVADTVFTEEGASEGAVEPETSCLVHHPSRRVDSQTHFHRSPVENMRSGS